MEKILLLIDNLKSKTINKQVKMLAGDTTKTDTDCV